MSFVILLNGKFKKNSNAKKEKHAYHEKNLDAAAKKKKTRKKFALNLFFDITSIFKT
ncbi:MAG: hypothetical protein KAH32_02540 [Chlamydiia bacterium]|nr:hypothetical protein [Chlamydiia bacterium]